MYEEHQKNLIISVKKEVQQGVINNLVYVEIMKRITAAVFPFMSHPLDKLAHNKDKVLQDYNQQVKKLNIHPQDKQYITEWETKLNGNSMSKSCCLMFDASQSILPGASCNDMLEEGKRKLNKLVEIPIR